MPFNVAEGQCFLDGNRRAALAAATVFLDVNGVALTELPEVLAGLILAMSEHRDKYRLAAELRKLAG